MEEQKQAMIAQIKHLLGESKSRFIAKRGVLMFGLPVALFTPIVRGWMDNNLSLSSYLENFTTYKFWIVLVNALVAGVIFGFYQWWRLSKVLKKLESVGANN